MRTKDRLAAELRKVAASASPANAAKYETIATLAEAGDFDDFTSPYDFPILTLHAILQEAGFTKFAKRVVEGEFDATPEESDEWAESPEGKAAYEALMFKEIP